MNQELSSFSLQTDVISAIGSFLFSEGFSTCEITPKGIMQMINQISDYYEEGVPLFPEVILTNDYNYFQTIPSSNIIIKNEELSLDEFNNVLKLCAPLALDNWVIFIEIKDNRMRYGLINAELNDTSPSIYNQTVGRLGMAVDGVTMAYIRNVGFKNVELVGFKKRKIISLNLNNIIEVSNEEITSLSKEISKDMDSHKHEIEQYFEKTIANSIKISHGNLIGVVKDDDTVINKLKEDEKDGVYLLNPIDIGDLIISLETEKTSELSMDLRNKTSVFTSMLNHDGITIITTKGRILGYHLFIGNHIPTGTSIIGGARTRAFHSMKYSQLFEFCLFKSQDGNIKIWSHDE